MFHVFINDVNIVFPLTKCKYQQGDVTAPLLTLRKGQYVILKVGMWVLTGGHLRLF
jgi:hypothetical protein